MSTWTFAAACLFAGLVLGVATGYLLQVYDCNRRGHKR